MNDDFWRLKITAFLHDPPDKCLGELGTAGHLRRAQEYIAILLGEEPSKREIKRVSGSADAIAATVERLPFPWWQTMTVNFRQEEPGELRRWVVHPLSGHARQLADIQAEEAASQVIEILQEIKAGAQEDARGLYLALWRVLPQRLVQNSGVWSALPADTRIPDHTIWHHMDAVAALASIYEVKDQPAFLLFSMGPVQDFIAAARTMRDLWTGSYLLSYLVWQGIKVVADACGPEAVIFPSLRGQPLVDLWLLEQGVPGVDKPPSEARLSPSLPNKFLAIVPRSQAEQLVREAKDAILERWKAITDAVRSQMLELLGADDNGLASWDDHVRCPFDYYHIVLPWPTDEVSQTVQVAAKLFGQQAIANVQAILATQDRIPEAHRDPRNMPIAGNCWSLLYKQASCLFDARKIVRTFEPWNGDPREKDTLDGQREQMGPVPCRAELWRRSDATQFWNRLRRTMIRPGISARLGPDERLSAVNLLKRFAWDCYFRTDQSELHLASDYRSPFPSTASVAVASWKKQIIDGAVQDPALREAIQKYCQVIHKFVKAAKEPEFGGDFEEIDGEWLFEESFTDARAGREGWGDEAKKLLPACRGALGNLKETLTEAAKSNRDLVLLGAPPKYYAVLFFDGDEIGKWLSGKKAPKIQDVLHPKARHYFRQHYPELLEVDRPLGLALHAAISEALANFSLRIAREIVRTRSGVLIYSGGDDALALVPVDTVLSCARALRAAFSGWSSDNGGAPEGFLRLDRRDLLTMGPTATASVGTAIAHYVHPLRPALEEGRKALNAAKEEYDRDALCISVLKRSGEKLITGAKWKIGSLDVVGAMCSTSCAFQSGVLSPRLAYRLRQEFAPFLNRDEATTVLPKALIRSEVRRLIDRSSQGAPAEVRQAVLDLADNLPSLEQLTDVLLVCAFLVRGGGE